MRKGLLVLGACLLCAGCGNKVVCTMSQESNGTKMSVEVSAPVKDGKITSATTKMTTEFKTKELAEQYCSLMKDSEGVKCDGKKVIIESTEETGESIKKADFIKSAEDEGFKCK